MKLVMLNGQEAVPFLIDHPSIMDLTMSVDYEEYEDDFRDIFTELTNFSFLPNLHSLSILVRKHVPDEHDSDIDTIISQDICRLVESRAQLADIPGTAKLRSFTLDCETRAGDLGQSIAAQLDGIIETSSKEVEEFQLEVCWLHPGMG